MTGSWCVQPDPYVPNPGVQVSIIPRTKGIFGFSQHLPSDQKLYTAEEVGGKQLSVMFSWFVFVVVREDVCCSWR